LFNNIVQSKELLKPEGQLQLEESELNEEMTRILNGNNPHAPHNVARFNHKEGAFKASPNVDHLVVHFEVDGYLIFREEDEEVTEGESMVLAAEHGMDKKTLLRNQFNFSARSSQTTENPVRVLNCKY
jgi:dynein intermediate chain 1